MSYEFSDTEAIRIKKVGNKFAIIGILLMIFGLFGVASFWIFASGSELFSQIFEAGKPLTIGIIGLLLFRPSDNLRRIANTEGQDIEELMTAIKEFNFAFKASIIPIVFLILLLITSFFLESSLTGN